MKHLALGMACASALAWCGPAFCDDQDPAALFKSLDKNGDGTLAADEISEERQRFYERLVRVGDKDDNKTLSRDEFVAAMSIEEKPVATPRSRPGGDRPMPGPGQFFARLDRNSDGKFTKEEIPEQAPAEMRERLERVFAASGKSELTREDFEKVTEKYGPPRRDGRPERPGERPRPEGDRDREMAKEGERRPGGDRDGFGPPRPPEGRDGFRGFGGPPRDGGGGSPLVRVLDRDDSGTLSRREIARIVDRFEELDRNDDGELDVAELTGGPGGFGRPGFDRGRFDRMARDGERRPEGPRDGERPRPAGPRDGDRPRPEGRPDDRPEGRPGFRPEGGPPRGERGPGRDGGRGGDVFARLDRDGDGSISKDEAPERMKSRFDDLDGNSDGRITGDELREAIAREFGVPGERRERRPEKEQ